MESPMNYYEERKQAKIERLRRYAANKERIAAANGFDILHESNSGIPFGQPILVGHHSEGRHRRHLARLNARIDKGMQASKDAERLSQAADIAESRTDIDSDNPEAPQLIAERLAKLEKLQVNNRTMNKLVKKCKGDVKVLTELIKTAFPEFKEPHLTASNLLTPDFAGRIGIPDYVSTNLAAKIRRYKKRQESIKVVQSGFEPFEINKIKIELINGQVQIYFGYKPCEATRTALKRSPLAFKWSYTQERWVRKHTETTCGEWFMSELKRVLGEAKI
jgi:hypothetical protein